MGDPRSVALSKRPHRYDFHCHTFLSDGQEGPTDMWNEADRLGHRALAVTDHVAMNDPRPLLDRLRQEARAWEDAPLRTLVGVEITKIPPRHIAETARAARRAGAEVIIVHGETLADTVPEGTNRAAIDSGEVDILAHPGLLREEDAERAQRSGITLELSARVGHSLTNGLVAKRALAAGVPLLVDSDAHRPGDLVSFAKAAAIVAGAAIPRSGMDRVLRDAPTALLKKAGRG